jgi:predicted CXXCH cytochrome family protein
MQPATEQSVRGDFADARITYGAVTSTFFRRGAKFFVTTDGADGTLQDFEIKYAFGVDPLQQYLIELPNGRVQPLSLAWDTRPREAGGQRWFHLYPDGGIEHGDDLHWTGRLQNWNFMCADCHSTGVRKGYDAASGRFSTTWSEINVGCEACHGPGARHVEWANASAVARSVFWRGGNGLPTTLERQAEISTCAQCHARRAQIADGYTAGASFADFYVPDLLVPGLYHSDGQQRDEVYVYGSFLQSRMHAAGVTCSDCHDPHSQRLRAEENELCVRCHSAPTYDAPTHHFHAAGSEAARCVSCHMPQTTYMAVDPRRDHSFRVPRPDRSVTLGVPNACSGCHSDRTPQWAADALRDRLGRDPVGYQQFAEAFHAAEQGTAGSANALRALAADQSQPAIVRASALARLRDLPDAGAVDGGRAALTDPDPSVRWAALALLERLSPRDRAATAARLLDDPARSVRIQAAWLLASAAMLLAGTPVSASFDRAAGEFVASQQYNADRVENRRALGTFYAQLGREADAEREFRAAVALSPTDPSSRHLLGLSLIRSRNVPAAIAELEAAATAAPERPEYAYAYAVALNGAGRAVEAIATLERALARHPRDRDLLFALATFNRDRGGRDAARRYAEQLSATGDPRGRALVESLR